MACIWTAFSCSLFVARLTKPKDRLKKSQKQQLPIIGLGLFMCVNKYLLQALVTQSHYLLADALSEC